MKKQSRLTVVLITVPIHKGLQAIGMKLKKINSKRELAVVRFSLYMSSNLGIVEFED